MFSLCEDLSCRSCRRRRGGRRRRRRRRTGGGRRRRIQNILRFSLHMGFAERTIYPISLTEKLEVVTAG